MTNKEIKDKIKLINLDDIYNYIKYHIDDENYDEAYDRKNGTYTIYKRRNKYSKWKEIGTCTEVEYNGMMIRAEVEKKFFTHTEHSLKPILAEKEDDINEIKKQFKKEVLRKYKRTGY